MSTETPEQRLEALGSMVDEVAAAHPAAVEEQAERDETQAKAEQHVDAAAKAWAMIPYSLGGMLTILAPVLREVYTPEACYAWGQSANAVAEKYGWNSPDSLPELALVTCSLGFAVPSYLAISEQMRVMKEGKAQGLWARVGVWWRARKAKREAAKAKAGDNVGAPTADAAAAG